MTTPRTPLKIRLRGSIVRTAGPNANATGAPDITGPAQVGGTLTARMGDIADPEGLPSGVFPAGYFVQWNPGGNERRHRDSGRQFGDLQAGQCRPRCCFADCLITDFSDYFVRWVRGFPTVFRDRRKMGRLAGCRTGVGASSRCAAPALRCGPSGDPPPCARLSASMAVSAAFGHGPIARRIVVAGA